MVHFEHLVQRNVVLIVSNVALLLTSLPCRADHAIAARFVAPDAQSSPIRTSISLQSGLLSGTANEYVFSGGTKTSQLDWGMNPVVVAGLTISASLFDHLLLNLGYWTGLNRGAGNVTDSDYTSFGVPSLFSKQDSILETARFFDVNAGYSYRIFGGLGLAGMVGYRFIDFKMTARDGYVQYPPGSAPRPFFGPGIAVEQAYDIPYIGIAATYEFLDVLYAELVPAYSPLVHCQEQDNHFRRQLDVFSSMSSGQYASLTAALGWKLARDTSVVLSGGYTSIAMAKGESYNVDLASGSTSPTAPNSASVGWNSASAMLSLAHSLTWR